MFVLLSADTKSKMISLNVFKITNIKNLQEKTATYSETLKILLDKPMKRVVYSGHFLTRLCNMRHVIA